MGVRVVEERKRKLDGRVLRYRCEALRLTPGQAVLLYRTPAAVVLAGVLVPAGSLSFGVYWTDRPYNVYHFTDPAGETILYYCNAAAETAIAEDVLEWLDLEADVVIRRDGSWEVLDLDQVPPNLTPAHRAALDAALAELARVPLVVAAADAASGPFRGAGDRA